VLRGLTTEKKRQRAIDLNANRATCPSRSRATCGISGSSGRGDSATPHEDRSVTAKPRKVKLIFKARFLKPEELKAKAP
jgi:hypothetical protein